MFRILQTFLLVLWLNSAPISAQLIECQRLYEILPLIEEDTLVVFNINNVLTVSCQDAGSTPWAEEHIARIAAEQNTTKPHATNLFIPLWHDILIASDVELFDPDAEAIVRYLQSKNVKVMALTNRYTEMGYPTHNNLRSVGIDFAKNPPHLEDFFIKGTGSPAKYIEGIIFNGLINFKGDSLAAFLKEIKYTPKKLIYIEDKPKHLAQVEQVISAMDIPFVGVHFGALELQRESYRPELAALQVKYHFDILDDASARRLYNRHQRFIPPEPEYVPRISAPLPDQMKTIQSLAEIESELAPQSMLVTELDHVLWQTHGSIGARSFLTHLVKKQIALGKTPEAAQAKAERTIEKIHRRAQVRLIEKDSAQFLKQLSEKNCWSVALSFRPRRLQDRTIEQANQLGLVFNSPFEGGSTYKSKAIFCSDYSAFEQKLNQLTTKPQALIAVSSVREDLTRLKEMADKCAIDFKGFLFRPDAEQELIRNDEILMLEMEFLDRLLTNEEATFLLPSA